MALTPEQKQAIFKASGMQGQTPQPGQAQGQYGGAVQGVSNAVRSLSGGLIPDTLARAYGGFHGAPQQQTSQQAIMSLAGPLGNVPTPQQIGQNNPFESQQQAQQENVNPMATAGKNAANFLPWLAGGMNPLGMGGKAMAARAAIGGGSSLAQNIAQGRGGDPISDAVSALTGAAANTYIPPALSKVGGKAAQLAYGKAGKMIPEIAATTGKPITGIASQGAKQARNIIGKQIGDVYKNAGVTLSKDDFFNMFNDKPNLDQFGNQMPSKLDDFMRYAGIPAEDKAKVLSFLNPQATGPKNLHILDAQAMRNAGGVLDKEFTAELNNYLRENPETAMKVAQESGTEPVDIFSKYVDFRNNLTDQLEKKYGDMASVPPDVYKNFQSKLLQEQNKNPELANLMQNTVLKLNNNQGMIPADFWHSFTQKIEPSQAVYDALQKNPDKELTVEDKIRVAMGKMIRNSLQDTIKQYAPQFSEPLQKLNSLYGAASPIATGKAQGIVPKHLAFYSQLAALGLLASPLTGMKNSQYLQMLAPLGFLVNPAVSGSLASQAATPTTNALINALSSLGASQFSKQIKH